MATKRKAKRLKKLTREQKKAIWNPSEANAGAGWDAKWGRPADPIKVLRDRED